MTSEERTDALKQVVRTLLGSPASPQRDERVVEMTGRLERYGWTRCWRCRGRRLAHGCHVCGDDGFLPGALVSCPRCRREVGVTGSLHFRVGEHPWQDVPGRARAVACYDHDPRNWLTTRDRRETASDLAHQEATVRHIESCRWPS